MKWDYMGLPKRRLRGSASAATGSHVSTPDPDFEGDLAPEIRGTVVALLRDLARNWQSSDLMDAAAYFEGTL